MSTRLVMAVVAAAIFISVLQQTFVNVVVPDIGQEFGASQGQVGWVITGYLLIFAVGIPLYGRVADLYSLRGTFTLGLLVLAAGSIVCAFAPSLSVLVAGRILQAAGAAAIPALGFASIAKLLPPGQRGTALGLLSSSVGVGAAVGPVVGGVIAGIAGWQSLFFVTLVLALLLAAGAWHVLPDAVSDHPVPGSIMEALHHFDVPGGLLLASAAGLALFGVTEGQVAGFASPLTWGQLRAIGGGRRRLCLAHPVGAGPFRLTRPVPAFWFSGGRCGGVLYDVRQRRDARANAVPGLRGQRVVGGGDRAWYSHPGPRRSRSSRQLPDDSRTGSGHAL